MAGWPGEGYGAWALRTQEVAAWMDEGREGARARGEGCPVKGMWGCLPGRVTPVLWDNEGMFGTRETFRTRLNFCQTCREAPVLGFY